jgi:uncharacterized protein (TIGR02757 family)
MPLLFRARPEGDTRRKEGGVALAPASDRVLLDALDDLYERLNRREYVHPDPLEFLYAYDDVRDREIAGLVASSLAYGRVAQILKSVAAILAKMPRPAEFLASATRRSLKSAFTGFKHRFSTGGDIALMLYGAKGAIEKHGSLGECFTSGLSASDRTIVPALTRFVDELSGGEDLCRSYLLPSPEAGSACKRLNLYLRWMVRRDAVDPGGWTGVPAAKLLVPLDTHMHRFCGQLAMTARKQADLTAAIEITDAFRRIAPEDPVKYDFALTRLGIRSDMDPGPFFERCSRSEVA